MPTFLAGIGLKALLAGVALTAILAIGWKIESDIETIGALKATNATLEQANQQNVVELAKIQADEKKAEDALAQAQQQDQQATTQQIEIERVIEHAPASERGATVPRLITDAISQLYDTGAGSGSQDSVRKAASPGRSP